MNKTDRLKSALKNKQIVEITTRFEDATIICKPLAISAKWLLIANIDKSIRYDGFQCIRQSDIRRLLVPISTAMFIETALQLRSDPCPSKPRIKLNDVCQLLKSASNLFPLITIHRQNIDPDVCHIGRVTHITPSRLSLLEIDPDACWEDFATAYNLREITRIDFGGGYEDALHLVGGEPPRS